MGRFGNVLLVGGETDLSLNARFGEVVRFYLTNTANTRVFNVGLPGARMKLVGGDSGRYEREEFVDEVMLAPSERAVVDVLFDKPGQLTLEHRIPDRRYPLATITVSDEPAVPSLAGSSRRSAPTQTWSPSASGSRRTSPRAPDKTLAFVAEMEMGEPEGAGRLRLPDAPRGRQRRARQLPEMRHEAARDRGTGEHLRLPDASGGRQREPGRCPSAA